MPPTKRDYQNFVETMESGRVPQLDPLLKQAAVKAELLTGDSSWDAFLQQLQATREQDLQEAEHYIKCLKTALGDKVIICQMNIAKLEARLELMDEIMHLPSKIVMAAHDA